jgi:hypothetical protein
MCLLHDFGFLYHAACPRTPINYDNDCNAARQLQMHAAYTTGVRNDICNPKRDGVTHDKGMIAEV